MNSTITLACSICVNPIPGQFSWYKNGSNINEVLQNINDNDDITNLNTLLSLSFLKNYRTYSKVCLEEGKLTEIAIYNKHRNREINFVVLQQITSHSMYNCDVYNTFSTTSYQIISHRIRYIFYNVEIIHEHEWIITILT